MNNNLFHLKTNYAFLIIIRSVFFTCAFTLFYQKIFRDNSHDSEQRSFPFSKENQELQNEMQFHNKSVRGCFFKKQFIKCSNINMHIPLSIHFCDFFYCPNNPVKQIVLNIFVIFYLVVTLKVKIFQMFLSPNLFFAQELDINLQAILKGFGTQQNRKKHSKNIW